MRAVVLFVWLCGAGAAEFDPSLLHLQGERADLLGLPAAGQSQEGFSRLEGAVSLRYEALDFAAEALSYRLFLPEDGQQALVEQLQIDGVTDAPLQWDSRSSALASVPVRALVQAERLAAQHVAVADTQHRYAVAFTGLQPITGELRSDDDWRPVAITAEELHADLVLDYCDGRIATIAVETLTAQVPAGISSWWIDTAAGERLARAQTIQARFVPGQGLAELHLQDRAQLDWQERGGGLMAPEGAARYRITARESIEYQRLLPGMSAASGQARGAVRIHHQAGTIDAEQVDWRLVPGLAEGAPVLQAAHFTRGTGIFVIDTTSGDQPLRIRLTAAGLSVLDEAARGQTYRVHLHGIESCTGELLHAGRWVPFRIEGDELTLIVDHDAASDRLLLRELVLARAGAGLVAIEVHDARGPARYEGGRLRVFLHAEGLDRLVGDRHFTVRGLPLQP